jgi:hypothetical protein
MNSLFGTFRRVVPALLVGVLVLTASADAHPRHRGKHKHHARPHRTFVERAPVCAPRVVHRPYRPARVVYAGTPFLYHANLGVYVSGVSLGIRLTNAAPAGYVYVDSICGRESRSVRSYRSHCREHGHPAYVTVAARGARCDTGYDRRYGGHDDDWSD